jgi:hypothetical protein
LPVAVAGAVVLAVGFGFDLFDLTVADVGLAAVAEVAVLVAHAVPGYLLALHWAG